MPVALHNPHPSQPAEMQQLAAEIDTLRAKIQAVHEVRALRADLSTLTRRPPDALSTFTKPPPPPYPPSTPLTCKPLPDPVQPPSTPKSRLGRFTAPFNKLSRRRCAPAPGSGSKVYPFKFHALDESSHGLFWRRGSDESGTTASSTTSEIESDPGAGLDGQPAELLAILAPLVSALQQLTARFLKLTPPTGPLPGVTWDEVSRSLDEACGALTRLVEDLRGPGLHSRPTRAAGVTKDREVGENGAGVGVNLALIGTNPATSSALTDPTAAGEYSYDLEMRALMLDALVKKVSTERGAVRNAIRERQRALDPGANPRAESGSPSRLGLSSLNTSLTNTDDPSDPSTPSNTTPTINPFGSLTPDSRSNPFIVHSTSLRLESVRRPSSSKAISPVSISSSPISSPIAFGTMLQPGPSLSPSGRIGTLIPGLPNLSHLSPQPSYRAFMGGVNSAAAWSSNVVRLGSFQASALFSPSPIAVRRLAGDGTKA